MFLNKFIVLLCLCGLQCPEANQPSQPSDDFNLLLMSFLAGNLSTSCQPGDLICFDQMFSDPIPQEPPAEPDAEGSEGGRILIVNRNQQPDPSPLSAITTTNNSTNSTSANVTVQNRTFDFEKCGTFPACSIFYLSGDRWSFTCDRALVSFTAAMASILCIIIIISNLLIIAVTLNTRSLRKPHGYFKLSLALADLIAGVFVLPSIIHNTLNKIDYNREYWNSTSINYFTGVEPDGSSTAIFFGVAGILSSVIAVYSMLLLSIDSFVSVKWPMKYRIGDIMNSRRAVGAVIFVWVVAILVAFLPVAAKDYVTYGIVYFSFQYIPIISPLPNAPDSEPARQYLHAIMYAIFIWGLPFVVTWILTVLTSIQSRRMLRNMREARRRSVRSANALNKVDRELIRTVSVVLTLFTVTVLPVFGVIIAAVLSPAGECYSPSFSVAFFASSYLLICGRFLNVIVYNVFNKDFRESCVKFLAGIAAYVFCLESERGLPSRSLSQRRSSSFWQPKKPRSWKSKYGKKTSVRSASASTDRGVLSAATESTTAKSKLSTSSASTNNGRPGGRLGSSVSSVDETLRK